MRWSKTFAAARREREQDARLAAPVEEVASVAAIAADAEVEAEAEAA